tara:strand:+ start:584 stop:904 length:321 start_codon:yes stop_codon:yes gene_type:complete
MTINSDVDIPSALQKLGKKCEVIGFTQAVPPHSITVWKKGESGDDQPTDDEINTAWTAYKNEDLYKGKREEEYPTIADQLDLIYHSGIDGWKIKIKEIKDKYPKPS